MNLEKYLSLVTHRSESIIQWLFFAILILSGVLIARALFGKKDESSAQAQAGGVDLQTALQKIMEQTTKLENVSLEKLSSQGNAAVEAQVQALKTDLAARETELNQLKASGGAKAAGPEMANLSQRIKELEAKLSEYEILEDDIADLSLYKEENARLRVELDKLKAGGAPAPAPAASGDQIVEQFAQVVSQPPVMEEPAAAPVEAAIPNTDDPMADFEKTMNLEKELEMAVPQPTPLEPEPPAPSAPAAVAAPEPVAASAQAEADDLFAEFSAGEETLDTDKMMAEMAALVGMEPSDSSLEEKIDTDKMAAEATSFSKA